MDSLINNLQEAHNLLLEKPLSEEQRIQVRSVMMDAVEFMEEFREDMPLLLDMAENAVMNIKCNPELPDENRYEKELSFRKLRDWLKDSFPKKTEEPVGVDGD